MRDTPENREFPQPWLKKPREAGQKTEPMTCPLRHGQPPQTGLPQHARSMRRRPLLCPYCPGGAKDPARRRLSRSRHDQTPTAGQDRSQRIGSKIPRLPASYCVPARSAYGSRQFFPCDEPLHDATLTYGRGRPRLLTEVSFPALPRFRKKFCLSAPCFRPFSCIDIDTRNVYDYILNFVEQFQHITRQICSPIAARP